MKFLVVIKKLFKLPINKLWDPPAVDPEFVKYEFFHLKLIYLNVCVLFIKNIYKILNISFSFVTVTFFKLLENVDVAKDKEMKTEIIRFLGTVLKEHRTGLGNYYFFGTFNKISHIRFS